jgi:ferredoxin-nitrite reductase
LAWIASGKKLSKEEQIKFESNPLDTWDRIRELSTQDALPTGPDIFRLKFHGLFNVAPAQEGMMCRLRIPGGVLSSAQFREIANCARDFGGGYTDITTRANFQIREIPGRHMTSLLESLHGCGIVPRGSGADNLRNITGNPTGGICSEEFIDVLPLCRSMHQTILHHRELYGLPRKFNIAFNGGGRISALEDTNDIGFQAVKVEADHATAEIPVGIYFRLALGGITGHEDFARDTGLLFKPEECVEVAVALVQAFGRLGDRGNRKKARLKYVLDRLGFEGFLKEAEIEYGKPFRRFAADACIWPAADDRLAHLGTHAQKQEGKFWAGVHIPVGRLTPEQMLGLAKIADRFGEAELRLTVWQNLIIPGIDGTELAEVENALSKLGLSTHPNSVDAGLVACTGSEGCKFGQAKTKATAREVGDYLRDRLELDGPINIHFTGCAHSCAQHFIGDIGCIATTLEKDGQVIGGFHLFVGGGYGSDARIAVPVRRSVPESDVPAVIEAMLRTYLSERNAGETFAGFTQRLGAQALASVFGAVEGVEAV